MAGGRFVTTHLIVRTEFLDEYPETVKDLLEGHVEATQWIEDNQDQAKSDVNEKLAELSGKPPPQEVIDRAWENLTITVDPIASSLEKSASDAVGAGLTEETELRGIYDLEALNAILESRGSPRSATAVWARAARADAVTTAQDTAGLAWRPPPVRPFAWTGSARRSVATSSAPVLDRVSVEVQTGEFVSLLGASGCGKSTLLNIAGTGAGHQRLGRRGR